jgi:hypothetical protein
VASRSGRTRFPAILDSAVFGQEIQEPHQAVHFLAWRGSEPLGAPFGAPGGDGLVQQDRQGKQLPLVGIEQCLNAGHALACRTATAPGPLRGPQMIAWTGKSSLLPLSPIATASACARSRSAARMWLSVMLDAEP